MNIAFICTANICRSVMAHAILERIARTRGLDFVVTSAGVLDFTGVPPADNAWLTCLQNDTPVFKMGSLFVGKLDPDGVDFFLVMEHDHRNILVSQYGIDGRRIKLLGTFDQASNEPEIADPIGKPKKEFQTCYDRIERCIEGFLAQLSGSEKDGDGDAGQAS